MKDNEMFDEKDNLTPEIEDVEISSKEEKPDFKSSKEPKKEVVVIVHTYSGHENKVKVNLEKRVEYMNMGEKIFRIEVPQKPLLRLKGVKNPKEKKRFSLDMFWLK